MARKSKQLMEEVCDLLLEAGAVISEKGVTKGGHQVVRWSLDGVGQVSFFSSTASCRRTHMNTVAMVRRQVRKVSGK